MDAPNSDEFNELGIALTSIGRREGGHGEVRLEYVLLNPIFIWTYN